MLSSFTVSHADPIEFDDDGGEQWFIKAITYGSGNWSIPSNTFEIDVLVVGGGGGSGTHQPSFKHSAGGGGGGLVWVRNITVTPSSNISYSVGNGGNGAATRYVEGTTGEDTVFGNLTAKGGGGGGSTEAAGGRDGGSGGGTASYGLAIGETPGGSENQTSQANWSGLYGHGNDGGSSDSENPGGGGGAGGASSARPYGGVGLNLSEYFGTTYGVNGVFAAGGDGSMEGSSNGSAQINTGNGGNAPISDAYTAGGNGGSGIILIRYLRNYAPIIEETYPEDGTLGVNNSLSQINVTINDPEGDTFNWTIETIPDIGDSSGDDEGNGTKICGVTGLAGGTEYTVYVNITDSEDNVRNETFTFTTFGDVIFYCYDESDPTVGLAFGVEITNSHFYTNHSLTNGASISIADLPYGNIVTFLVSSTGYVSRLYVYTISPVGNYNFTFYLPTEKEETTLRTTSLSVSNPAVNLSITLDCIPEIIISVQGWNTSDYGHWFEVPNDKYTVTDDVVEVDESWLDENTSLVKVTYYCSTDGAVQYLLTVYGPQGEYGYDPPISGATIDIKRYMNTTGQYETVSIVITDGNGNADVFLMPGPLYRFSITKSGYNTENVTKSMTDDVRYAIFRLYPTGTYDPDDPDADVFYDNFWSDITLVGTLYENNTIHILFLDSSSRIINTQIRVYDFYNNEETYLFVDSRTGEDSFSFWRSVTDSGHDHKIRLWFNTSAEYSVNIPVVLVVYGVGKSWDDTIEKFNLTQRIENVFGSYVLDYSDTICVIVAVVVLAMFGPFHVGAGVILSGFSVIFTQALFYIWTVNVNALLISLGVLALFLGILHVLSFKPEEHI